jgi:hypothetical protein
MAMLTAITPLRVMVLPCVASGMIINMSEYSKKFIQKHKIQTGWDYQ